MKKRVLDNRNTDLLSDPFDTVRDLVAKIQIRKLCESPYAEAKIRMVN